ncbi:ribonuclease H [Senna tora]|uniref:Ribonuclease H n=1 Tax=Senna tora TaxID=362788 RepID=A0A834TMN7_9FABA|nr:ribonuclease H [Senna tora]
MDRLKEIELGEEEVVIIEEGGKVDEPGTNRLNLCLAGSVWGEGHYNHGAFQRTISQVWRPKHGVDIKEIDKNLYMFQFFHWRDRDKVLEGEPWWFDKQVLTLKEVSGDEQPSELRSTQVPFWVRVYDLPFNQRTIMAAQMLGDKVGNFLDWDNSEESKWGKAFRFRAMIDLTKPLKKGTLVRGKNDKTLKECNDNANGSDSEDEASWTYGPWLRASPFKAKNQHSTSNSYGGKSKKMLFKPSNKQDQKGSMMAVQMHHGGRNHEKVTGIFVCNKGIFEEVMAGADLTVSQKSVTDILNGSFNSKLTLEKKEAGEDSEEKTPSIKDVIIEQDLIEENKNLITANTASNGPATDDKGVVLENQDNGPSLSSSQAHLNSGKKWTRIKREPTGPMTIISTPKLQNGVKALANRRVLPVAENSILSVKRDGSHLDESSPAAETVRDLQSLTRSQSPSIVFLMETRFTKFEMERIKRQLNFDGLITVPCRGRGKSRAGGLALLWKQEVTIDLQSFSLNHIDVHIKDDSRDLTWRFTGFYGFPDEAYKKLSWKLLQDLNNASNLPWLCSGDFNEIILESEKKGGAPKNFRCMMEFREALDICGLQDIGFTGYPYTWSNGRCGEDNIQERLDQACASEEWLSLFPFVSVEHNTRSFSYHCAVVITFDDENPDANRKAKRLFRFEESWCNEDSCGELVDLGWEAGSDVVDKIKKVASCFKEANFHNTGSIRRKIKHLEESITILKQIQLTDAVRKNIQDAQAELDQLLKNEEILWRQRSRAVWLKEGDLNTKFFHRKANQRRNRNAIRRIRDDQNRMHSDLAGITNTITSYFCNLFKASNLEGVEDVCKEVKRRISEDQCTLLSRPYSNEEVKAALDSMHPSKAPGPDAKLGYNPSFVWRGILNASKVIHEGATWRVGNGCNINVWSDKWISSVRGSKVISKSSADNSNLMVSDLIHHDCRKWNLERIDELFLPFEAKMIKSIPLSWRNVEDRLMWPLEKHGNYSVRSAYHFISNSKLTDSSSSSLHDSRWGVLWGLSLPPKVKVFMWRLCHGAIASNLNVHRRGVQCDTCCFTCCDKVESETHLFLRCPKARELWFASPLGFFPTLDDQNSFRDWFWDRLAKDSNEIICWIALICWSIWKRRNAFVFEQKLIPLEDSLSEATRLIKDFNDVNCRNSESVMPTAAIWMPPMPNKIKINTDAARISDIEWGLGVVARDSLGNLIFVAASKTLAPDDPSLAEALALRWAMGIAYHNEMLDVVFESDCLVVINNFSKANKDVSILENIIHDCDTLSKGFNSCTMTHTKREGNRVAHHVARTLHSFEIDFWFSNFPFSVMSLAQNDVLRFNNINE